MIFDASCTTHEYWVSAIVVFTFLLSDTVVVGLDRIGLDGIGLWWFLVAGCTFRTISIVYVYVYTYLCL